MSVECLARCQASALMSTSGSSAADTPESVYALSVLDFAERYTDDTARQVTCARLIGCACCVDSPAGH